MAKDVTGAMSELEEGKALLLDSTGIHEEGTSTIATTTTTRPKTIHHALDDDGIEYIITSNGKKYVPEDGVVRKRVMIKEGQQQQQQVFVLTTAVPVEPLEDDYYDNQQQNHDIPNNHWRDGLFDCFNDIGICFMSCCCYACVLGQLMTRLRLGWCGEEERPRRGNDDGRRRWLTPFKAFWIYTFLTILLNSRFTSNGGLVSWGNDTSSGAGISTGASSLITSWYYYPSNTIVSSIRLFDYWLFLPYLLWLTYRSYTYISKKYQIHRQNETICNLCCKVFCCRVCLLAQMMRHTANHNKYPYNVTSDTGLASYNNNAPPTIV